MSTIRPSKRKQNLNNKLFVGKTVKEVDSTAVNCCIFHFTDGTSVMIETEAVMPTLGLYGLSAEEYKPEMPK
jgi:hypothetical protein